MAEINLPAIVVVDDEKPILDSIAGVFARQKIHVETFLDARDALEFLLVNRVHVVISDMRMPNMMGQDFLAEVFNIQPSTYRIVLTGFADMDATLEVVNRGGDKCFFAKTLGYRTAC